MFLIAQSLSAQLLVDGKPIPSEVQFITAVLQMEDSKNLALRLGIEANDLKGMASDEQGAPLTFTSGNSGAVNFLYAAGWVYVGNINFPTIVGKGINITVAPGTSVPLFKRR
jgi:hypothetical protein